MAKFGAGLMQGLVNPQFGDSLQRSAAGLAQGVAELPKRMEADKKAEELKAQLASLDLTTPQGLAQAAKISQAQGDIRAAAQYAQSSRELAVRQQEEARKQASRTAADELADAQMERALQIAEAAQDETGMLRLSSGVETGAEYITRKTDKPADKDFTLSEGAVRYDAEGNVIAENPKAGVAGSNQWGLTANSTAEDFDNAIAAALNATESSLANSMMALRDKRFPPAPGKPGISDAIKIATDVDPNWKQHLEFRDTAASVQNLFANRDNAGATRMLQRTLTSMAPNDLKALQELKMFESNKSLGRRIGDYITNLSMGRPSELTLQEYTAIADGLATLSNQKTFETITRIYDAGGEDEGDILMKLFGNDNMATFVE